MIYLIGLGHGDDNTLSEAAKTAIRQSDALFIRTVNHPSVQWIYGQKIPFKAFDEWYETAVSFEILYSNIAEAIVECANQSVAVGYAVPGHPLIGEISVRHILKLAEQKDIPCRIASSPSFIDPVIEAALGSLSEGMQIWDAYSIRAYKPDPRLPQLIYQVDSRPSASEVKLKLMEVFPDEHPVFIIKSAGTQNGSCAKVLLYEMDRADCDPLTSVFVPELSLDRAPGIAGMIEVVRTLRGPDGCPWDKKQTPKTLKKYIIEEAYETCDAIDSENPDKLCEELGDLLLQVFLQGAIAEEEGVFTIDDIADTASEKLIRRHPHVFSDVKVESADEVLSNWDKIKTAERGETAQRASILESVPLNMPSLFRAQEVSKRAARVGFEWENVDDVFDKMAEETAELRKAMKSGDSNQIEAEIGDLLFTIVNIARHLGIDAEEALRRMVTRFTQRFSLMEQNASEQNKPLEDLTYKEWDDLWNSAKQSLDQ